MKQVDLMGLYGMYMEEYGKLLKVVPPQLYSLVYKPS